MQLVLNGKPYSFAGSTIRELLDILGLHGRLAVEVNQDIIPKGEHDSYVLADGDAVEIVHAIGGG
jgi:sulfur carrier protein